MKNNKAQWRLLNVLAPATTSEANSLLHNKELGWGKVLLDEVTHLLYEQAGIKLPGEDLNGSRFECRLFFFERVDRLDERVGTLIRKEDTGGRKCSLA